MNYNISFSQMNKLGREILLKQPRLSSEDLKKQVQRLKKKSQTGQKKKGHCVGTV